MNSHLKYIVVFLILFSCKSNKEQQEVALTKSETHLTIAFGSCNRQTFDNKLWDPIAENDPTVWIWGGDVIYSDTDNMELMQEHYDQQMNQKGYREFAENVKILGTWDDHDYGLNDGGTEFTAKSESQQLFLDFIGVAKDDERRTREGVYHSEMVRTEKGTVNIIVLDTRYFRTSLTPSADPEFRYQPNAYGEGSMLGEIQWNWLEKELHNTEADFNLIMSSIQFLSKEHGSFARFSRRRALTRIVMRGGSRVNEAEP